MAWPNPFRRHNENTIDHYGYVFDWTPDHMTEEECAPLRQSYDVLGEQTLDRLDEISPPPKNGTLPRNQRNDDSKQPSNHDRDSPIPTEHKENKTKISGNEETPTKPPSQQRDLYAILKEHHASDPTLQRFWDQVNHVPEWVDWSQIARGQDVFYRYGGANITGLAYQSLLGGMGAARVVETLARTGGFSPKVARGRLFETTQHILQCTRSLADMQPGGEGWISTIRVRLLHAAVRRRIMKLEKTRPEYYSSEKYGVPINDLDSIATVISFSATLIWLSLPRQGIWMRAQERKDYIALWRYIGHVIGCPVTPYLATEKKAKAVLESLYYLEIRPSETSALLANNIITAIQDQPPGYASRDFLVASARWLNGPSLSDELGLKQTSWYYTILMAGQCLFFCSLIYINRSVESWDKSKLELVRRIFWTVIVDSKYGLKGEQTGFEFKYVPEYATIAEMGSRTKGREMELLGKGEKGEYDAERRNLKVFLMATTALGVGACVSLWIGSRLLPAALQRIW